jgi:hypothetical protein
MTVYMCTLSLVRKQVTAYRLICAFTTHTYLYIASWALECWIRRMPWGKLTIYRTFPREAKGFHLIFHGFWVRTWPGTNQLLELPLDPGVGPLVSRYPSRSGRSSGTSSSRWNQDVWFIFISLCFINYNIPWYTLEILGNLRPSIIIVECLKHYSSWKQLYLRACARQPVKHDTLPTHTTEHSHYPTTSCGMTRAP